MNSYHMKRVVKQQSVGNYSKLMQIGQSVLTPLVANHIWKHDFECKNKYRWKEAIK